MSEISLLIISLIGNIILVVLFFFKSAINDILKERWSNKQKIKREQKERLIDLRTNLIRLSTLSFLGLVTIGVWKSESDPIIKEELIRKSSETFEEWGALNNAIIKNEMYYPKEIRDLYTNFSGKMKKFTGEILKEVPYKEKLLEMSEEIKSIISEMVEKIEDYIS
jgi:hypothetical protein